MGLLPLSPYVLISLIFLFSIVALSLAPPLSPLSLDSEHCCSFLFCACCHIMTTIHFLPLIWTPTIFHVWCHAMSLAGHSLLDFLIHLFPSFSYIVYIVTLLDSNCINILSLASLKGRQLWPPSLSLSLYVCLYLHALRIILTHCLQPALTWTKTVHKSSLLFPFSFPFCLCAILPCHHILAAVGITTHTNCPLSAHLCILILGYGLGIIFTFLIS
jgi:hypothetical protein